jgi:hypothetical protein
MIPVLRAQDDDLEDMDFEEVPIVEERPTYFAIGAGYIGTLSWINLDEINAKISNDFLLPEYSGSLYLSGAHGFTGIGIIPNLRLGFFGITGKQKVDQNQDSIKYGSSLSLNYTGFSVDYGFVLFDHFAILPGIQVGWSSLNINIYRTLNTADSPDWTQIKLEDNPEYFSKDMNGSFWYVQPQIYLEYALTPFLMARASAGYNLSFNTSWEYNSSADLKNVPDGITTGGFSAQFGIFVGLFNF